MPPTYCTTSTCHYNLNIIENSKLPSLKDNNNKSFLQNLKELIPLKIINYYINQQSLRICTQINAERIQYICPQFDNL